MHLEHPSHPISLRDWQLDDLPYFAHWLQPGHDWQKLDAPYYPSPDADEILGIIESEREKINTAQWPTPRTRLVIAQNGQMIGMVSRYWISEETDWSAVGIILYDPAH
jgi:hypothetical protein